MQRMSIYSPPTTPPGQRRVKPLPKRQRTPPSTSPAPLAVQDYYVPLISSLLEETRNEGGNAKKRKVPHAIGGEVQGRVSRITAAGIQFRESVRVRRKHLEGLIEEGEGDTIEKALMLGLLGPGDRDGKRRRLSKRLVLRAGRAVPRGKTEPLKTCENFQFTYSVPSQGALFSSTRNNVPDHLSIQPRTSSARPVRPWICCASASLPPLPQRRNHLLRPPRLSLHLPRLPARIRRRKRNGLHWPTHPIPIIYATMFLPASPASSSRLQPPTATLFPSAS